MASPAPVEARRRRAAERHGRLAEWVAIGSLLLRGYVPLARRVKTPLGEIDLIARRGAVVAVIEVKNRADMADGVAAVPPRQRERLHRATAWWLARHPRHAGAVIRHDLMVVAPWRAPHHLIGALAPDPRPGAPSPRSWSP